VFYCIQIAYVVRSMHLRPCRAENMHTASRVRKRQREIHYSQIRVSGMKRIQNVKAAASFTVSGSWTWTAASKREYLTLGSSIVEQRYSDLFFVPPRKAMIHNEKSTGRARVGNQKFRRWGPRRILSSSRRPDVQWRSRTTIWTILERPDVNKVSMIFGRGSGGTRD